MAKKKPDDKKAPAKDDGKGKGGKGNGRWITVTSRDGERHSAWIANPRVPSNSADSAAYMQRRRAATESRHNGGVAREQTLKAHGKGGIRSVSGLQKKMGDIKLTVRTKATPIPAATAAKPGSRFAAAREAVKAPVPAATREKVVAAFNAADSQASKGAPVSIADVRARLSADLPKKSAFDRVMKKLNAEGEISLHRSDFPGGMAAKDRAKLVRGTRANRDYIPGATRRVQGDYYLAASLRKRSS
jgi:hypothetical protein